MHPRTILASALCTAGLTEPAWAGGISLYEIASADVGLASAGYAARAQDASTLFTNPAGMSRLTDAQFTGGLQLLYGSVEFSVDPADTSPLLRDDGDGGNAIGALPAASAFFVQPLSERVAIGLGTFSYFGLMQDYDDGWAGRYYVQDGALLGMSLMPGVSVRLTDWLSVGAGLNAMFGYFDTDVAVRTGAPADGQLSLKDETWGFGANAGILVELGEGTRLGVTYLSPVELDFAATPRFSNLGPLAGRPVFDSPGKLDLGVTVPQSVMFSVSQQINPCWTLLANVGWQNWDQFGKVEVGVDSSTPTTLTTDLQYQDTWHVALGAQYTPAKAWRFSTGVAYDSSAVGDEHRTFSNPMGESYRFGVGAQWHIRETLNLGAAYEFLWAGDMSVDQNSTFRGRVTGAYEDAWFSFFTAHLVWRF